MEKTYNCIHKAAQTGPSLILPIFFCPIGHICNHCHIAINLINSALLILFNQVWPCLFSSSEQ